MCGNIIDRDGYYPGFISPLLFLGLGPWWLGLVWSLNTLPAPSEAFCTPTHTHTHSPLRCHTFPTAQCEITWNGSVCFFSLLHLHCPHLFEKEGLHFHFAWRFCVLTLFNSLPQRDLTQNVHRFVYK